MKRYQLIVALRHGRPNETEVKQTRFTSLSFEGIQVASHMAAGLFSRLEEPVTRVVSGPLQRAADSVRVFLATGTLYHRGWQMPDQPRIDERLTAWSSSRIGEVQKARHLVKARQEAGDNRSIAEIAFSNSECHRGLARSGSEGWHALLALAGNDPGVFVGVGLHSPQIDAIGLIATGHGSLARTTGFTPENVVKVLGGYSRPGEGWYLVRDCVTHQVSGPYPLKYSKSLEAMIPHLKAEQMDLERALKIHHKMK